MNKLLVTLIAVAFAGATLTATAADNMSKDAPKAAPAAMPTVPAALVAREELYARMSLCPTQAAPQSAARHAGSETVWLRGAVSSWADCMTRQGGEGAEREFAWLRQKLQRRLSRYSSELIHCRTQLSGLR